MWHIAFLLHVQYFFSLTEIILIKDYNLTVYMDAKKAIW